MFDEGTPSSPAVGKQLRLALFQDGDFRLQLLELPVDAGKLRLHLPVFQVVAPVLLLDQRLDFPTNQSQTGDPVDRVVAVLELSSPDGLDDLVLRQPELLAPPSCR